MRYQIIQFGEYDFRVRFQHEFLIFFPYWTWGKGISAVGEPGVIIFNSADEARGKALEYIEKTKKVKEADYPKRIYDSNQDLPSRQRLRK